MFEFKCFEYLKELHENPQNEKLFNEFVSFLQSNKDKVEQFIIQNSMKPEHKKILMQAMSQEFQESQNTTQQNSNNINIQNLTPPNVNNNEVVMNEILQLFEQWKIEYFKIRKVTPKCIEIAEQIINNYLLERLDLIKTFQDLPTNQNEAFKNFKNHVLNVLAVNLIEGLQHQITELKKYNISFIKKWALIFKLEKEQKKISKKNFDIQELEELFELIEIVKGGVN